MILKKQISNEHGEEILKEMFRRVGVDKDSFDFTGQWYLKNSWTEEDQEDYRIWLGKKLTKWGYTKGIHRGKDHGYYEAGKILLNYGWKVTPERE